MKPHLALLAFSVLGASAFPALAFKNIEGCDIAVFAAKNAPVRIAPERWQAYHDAAAAVLGAAPQTQVSVQEWRPVAAKLIEAQTRLLAPDKAETAYQDYLAGDSCRVLSKLDSGAIQSLYDEVAQSAPEQAATSLRRVAEAARTQIDRIERSARFRSGQDRTAMQAQYYCFVAGAIAPFLPPKRRQTIALSDFGETVSCKEIGRTP